MGSIVLWVKVIDGKPDLPPDIKPLAGSTIDPDAAYCAVELDDSGEPWKMVDFVGKNYDKDTNPYDLMPPPDDPVKDADDLAKATPVQLASMAEKRAAYDSVCALASSRRAAAL